MNKKYTTFLLSVLIFSFSTTTYAADNVYINQTYSKNNSGKYTFGIDAFTSIQDGINAVNNNGVVHITEGTYHETLHIEKSLSLTGNGSIQASGASKHSPRVDGGSSTTPATITIDGRNSNSITVKITNLTILNSGNGINVLQNAVVHITNNTVRGYRKNGITFGPVLYPGYGGVRGIISNNIITGSGPSSTVSQNGIQISENNTATIISNKISNHIYTKPDSFWASGILIHKSNNTFTSKNSLQDNQAGINIMQGSYNSIIDNTITGNSLTKAGITLNGSGSDISLSAVSNKIHHNAITGGSVGIWASNTASTTYSNNIISSSTDNGIYSWNNNNEVFSSNTLSHIHSQQNNAWGIVVDGDLPTTTQTPTILSSNRIMYSDLGFWIGTSLYNGLLTNNTFNNKTISKQTSTGQYITTELQDTVLSKNTSLPIIGGLVLGVTTYNFLHDVQQGDSGRDVTQLQKLLISNGFLTTKVTGYFGASTKEALILWQKDNNLPATGYLGIMTRNFINAKNK